MRRMFRLLRGPLEYSDRISMHRIGRSRQRAGALVMGTILCSALLAACSGGVEIPQSAFHIDKCLPRSEPYPVTDLGKHEGALCDLVGQEVIFPNDHHMLVPPIGSTDSEGGSGAADANDTYTIFNFGTFGLVVAQRKSASSKSQWWGAKESLVRYQAVYGQDAPYIFG
jgi:hypothetical protein